MVVSAAAHVEELLAHASELRRQGRLDDAIAAYQSALDLQPALPDAWYNLGYLQRHARQHDAALVSYQRALDGGVNRPEEVHLNRAVILSDFLARPAAAEAELQAALAINPDYVPALLNLGNLHEDRGDRAAARQAYERALALDPAAMLALARLAGVTDLSGPEDPVIHQLKHALASPLDQVDRADLGFALGRALDAVGAYDEAFAAYAEANQAGQSAFGRAHYDREAHERLVDRLIASFPGRAAGSQGSADPVPIFICGMFRSGSTLVERILAGHSKVTAGGELGVLPTLIQSELQPYPEAAAGADDGRLESMRQIYLDAMRSMFPGSQFVTDKRPDNFLHIGLIKALFPAARIVHTRRNPLDNCLSVYFLQNDPSLTYAFDLLDTAHWYRQQRRLMAHWQSLYADDILELDYDGLVADPRPALQRLLDHCGLQWEEACLDFHQGKGIVKTASVWQVREPLYQRSSGRWRHYERHLGALRSALEGATA